MTLTAALAAILKYQSRKHAPYSAALHEIQQGQKRSHWIWYVWPSLHQVRRTSKPQLQLQFPETLLYLQHKVLRKRLLEVTRAATQQLAQGKVLPAVLFGSMAHCDAPKFAECLGSFAVAAAIIGDDEAYSVCIKALEAFVSSGKEKPRKQRKTAWRTTTRVILAQCDDVEAAQAAIDRVRTDVKGDTVKDTTTKSAGRAPASQLPTPQQLAAQAAKAAAAKAAKDGAASTTTTTTAVSSSGAGGGAGAQGKL